METAIVYPNRHVRITSTPKLNNQKGIYISYGGLKSLIKQGYHIKFFRYQTNEDVTALMLRKIDLTAQLTEIKQEFNDFKMETDNSDDYDPFANRSRITE